MGRGQYTYLFIYPSHSMPMGRGQYHAYLSVHPSHSTSHGASLEFFLPEILSPNPRPKVRFGP